MVGGGGVMVVITSFPDFPLVLFGGWVGLKSPEKEE